MPILEYHQIIDDPIFPIKYGALIAPTITLSTTTQKEYVESEIKAVWGVNSQIGIDIARCESQLRQYDEKGGVLRGIQVKEDTGAFQVNTTYHLETAINLGIDIFTLNGNVRYAKRLFDLNGTRDWNASKKCWSK